MPEAIAGGATGHGFNAKVMLAKMEAIKTIPFVLIAF
jgi:hypothetical protein